MAKKRGLSAVVAAALIAAATNAPITAYVAYTHHIEEMARISAEAEKRASDETTASGTKAIEVFQARCSAALQFLADEHPNPLLKPAEAQALLTDMRQVASTSCNATLPDTSRTAYAQPKDAKETRR